MKRIIIFIIIQFLVVQITQAKNTAYLEYIDKYKNIAIAEMNSAGIPASIKLAQGLLESNAGRSYLAKEANNHFGIKCGSRWNGKKKYREDDDYNKKGQKIKSCFRHFPSGEESYYAHSQFLSDPNKAYRYGFLFDLGSGDYVSWAKGLSRSGYATNPKYSQLLINLIETYELWQYDHPMYDNVGPTLASTTFTFEINGASVIQALDGDSPNSLAIRTKVSLKKILKHNKELYVAGQSLSKGQVVYLQSKRKKNSGKKKMHIVRLNQTIFDISQQYGIFEESLRRRNRMSKYQEPKKGEYVYLRGKRSRRDKIKIAKVKASSRNAIKKESKPKVEQKGEDKILKVPNISEDFAGITGDHLDFIISPQENIKFIARGVSSEPKQVEHNINLVITIDTKQEDKRRPLPEERSSLVEKKEAILVEKKTKLYTVLSGDTLYKISRIYNMRVEEIKTLNGLKTNNLAIGQEIIIR